MTLLPEFHDQLHAAARRRARRHRRLIPPALPFAHQLRAVGASVPVLMLTLIAVAVAVVAVTTLSHGRAARSAAQSPVASSRQALIQTLGVLRTPQTKADLVALRPGALPGFLRLPTELCSRSSRSPLDPLCAAKLDKSLVRRVRVPGLGYEVGFFPAFPAASKPTRFFPQGGEGLAISLHGPGIYLVSSGPQFADAAALRAHGLVLSTNVGDGINRGVIIVPDGVAKVALRAFQVLAPRRAYVRAVVSTTPVRDNVTLFQLGSATVSSLGLDPATLGRFFSGGSGRGCELSYATYALPASARMIWFSPDGNVIHQETIQLPLYVSTHHPSPGATPLVPGPARRRACAQQK